ncbi:MAG: glycosyltransferase family 4 protein [Coriobacteriia bacterium]
MRIAMVGQKQTASRSGGVEVVVGELAHRMAALGHEVVCYDRTGAGMPSEPYERDGYRVVPVRALDVRGLSALTSSFAATEAALRDNPDVIHYHAEGLCVPLRRAHDAGVRTVATIHGLDWQRAKWGGLASRYIKHGEKTAARYADGLIVLSRANQAYFRETYGREATLVPNGVSAEPDLPAREITGRWGLSEGSYVLYLGRIVPEKRPELLVEAFRGLDTDKRLVIAGDSSDTGEYTANLKKTAALDPRVLFTGRVEGDLLAELFSNAYCYVLPSDVEGMPMSLLEAMSHGRACVTSDIPECADVLGGCGAMFPAGAAAALRYALAPLIADPARAATLGERARARALAEFSWDTAVERTLALYVGAPAAVRPGEVA